MSTEPVRFESVCPRDVDLLVLEELTVSSAFRSWLLESIGLSTPSETLAGAWHSAIDGEPTNSNRARQRTDVEFDLEIDGDRLLVVLATAFGDETPSLRSDGELERYRTRRERALATEWDDCRTVLVAPAAATPSGGDTESPFDATVTLESIRDWFLERDTDRDEYRAALLSAALDPDRQQSRAHEAAPDRGPSIRDQYQSALVERAPDLTVTSDSGLGTSVSDSDGDTEIVVSLDAPALASDHRLVHDLRGGTVDLRIPGAAVHIESFAARYAAVLSPATNLLTADDALVLRRSVPPIDPAARSETGSETEATSKTFQEQYGDALEAICDAVADLLELSERIQERPA